MSPGGVRGQVATARALLDRPLASYYLVLGITLLLAGLGLAMVFSTTTTYQLMYHQSEYSEFEHQLLGVIAGLALMWAAAKSPPRLFRALAWPLLVASLIGLAAVLVAGQSVNGATRWIDIGPIQIQPSEFAKLAFALWGAGVLARREELSQLTDWRLLLFPLLPAAAVICMLVIAGNDRGTTFLLLLIMLALLWVIGTPVRLFVLLLGLIALAMLALIIAKPYALERLTSFLSPHAPLSGGQWQATEGRYAIGSGGLFGAGLGAGGGQWGWVPNSTTDFIFAILGEQLGLIGTLCVSMLYAGLAYAGLRIARRVTDVFMRLAAAAITAWIVGQAMVNIGAVLGVLPITGVPLPLISYGLSSLLVTMAALGMLLAFARCEPGAAQARAAAGRRTLSRAPGRAACPGRAPHRDRAPHPGRSVGAGIARPPASAPAARPGTAGASSGQALAPGRR